MSGTNPAGQWALTFSTGPSVQGPTAYKGAIDANFAVAQRVADAFAPNPSTPAAMTVDIDPGFTDVIAAGQQIVTEVVDQTVAITAAPNSPNNRIDLIVVDAITGIATVVVGTPATVPAAPALPIGKRQVALISVPNGTVAIGNAQITDVRAVWGPASSGIPSGVSFEYSGSVLPAGYLWEDGSSYPTSLYPALFAAIGYTYGGVGANFNVPNHRARVAVGFDAGNATGLLTNDSGSGISAATLGNVGGTQDTQLLVTHLPAHTHTVEGTTGNTLTDHTHTFAAGVSGSASVAIPEAGGNAAISANTFLQEATGSLAPNTFTLPVTLSGLVVSGTTSGMNVNHQHPFATTTDPTGSNSPHNNVQPSIVKNFIIKY